MRYLGWQSRGVGVGVGDMLGTSLYGMYSDTMNDPSVSLETTALGDSGRLHLNVHGRVY